MNYYVVKNNEITKIGSISGDSIENRCKLLDAIDDPACKVIDSHTQQQITGYELHPFGCVQKFIFAPIPNH